MSTKRYAVLFLGLLAAQPVMAKDVATEQYNVSAAREHYNEVRSEYEDLTQRTEAQAKRVAQEQARLDEMRKEQKAVKARLDAAKNKLKQREQALNKAWGS
jgi:septal ring factor EnvC (AmiA/AmiB activator)